MSATSRRKPSRIQPKPQPIPESLPATRRDATVDWAIWLALVVAIFVVYAQVGKFEFINYDDDQYVYRNPAVPAGLTPANIKYAFTAIVASNWMPVTLLSHMLDAQLFGLESGMHHLVNVLLHALSAVLLFVTLKRATGARGASAFVAFLFALHPLHVESVAWVAERKDVLSTLFWFLGLYAYVRYVEQPAVTRYLLVAAALVLGLLSKPMLVTFPFTLLLFDLWPLERPRSMKLVWEKLPLFALSAAASVVTYFVQQAGGALRTAIPLATRLENAINSYLVYIAQMFQPGRLAIFYPYPNEIAAWQAVAALVIVAAVSAWVIREWRTRPYYAVGWFWYLGTLVPVIGLVQVGSQSHADRYTYVPLIGLSILLAWGARDVIAKWPGSKPAVAAAAALACVVWLAMAYLETGYWQNSATIFQHAIDIKEESWTAYYNWGYYEQTLKRYAGALPLFKEALRLSPGSLDTDANIGFCLMKVNRAAEAIPYLEAVLRSQPEYPDGEYNLGEALANAPGRDAEAIPHLQAALRANPNQVDAMNDLGACLMNNGRAAEAIPYLESAVRLKPDSTDAHFNFALALMKVGREADAIAQYEQTLRLKPDYGPAHYNLAMALLKNGKTDEAISRLETATRVNPEFRSQRQLGLLLAAKPGKQAEAIAHLEAAQRLMPDPDVTKALERLRAGRK